MQATKPIVVSIDYCNAWGYFSKFNYAKSVIQQAFPGAQVQGNPGKGGSGAFEIHVNGKKVHSKLGGEGVVTTANQEQLIARIKAAI